MYDSDSPGCCDCTNGDAWKEDWYVQVPWLNTQYVTINILSMVKLLKLSFAYSFHSVVILLPTLSVGLYCSETFFEHELVHEKCVLGSNKSEDVQVVVFSSGVPSTSFADT